jgi:hypothetical protein
VIGVWPGNTHLIESWIWTMQTVADSSTQFDREDLPSMLATLCSYESWFGPYHPQTLCLMAKVAFACRQSGELVHARILLERVVRDVGRFMGRNHHLRLRAITNLTDLFVTQRDYARAATAQRELLECQTQLLGSDHPDTLATRASLEMIHLEGITSDPARKV